MGSSRQVVALLALSLAFLPTQAAWAGNFRDRTLRSCGFDPVSFSKSAEYDCHLSQTKPPGPRASNVEIKLYKVQQLLDGAIGAALFYNVDLTEATLVSCLNQATTGENHAYDWCAMFALNTALSVDEKNPRDPSVIHASKDGFTDFLMSAYKLRKTYHDTPAFIPPNRPPEPGCLAVWTSSARHKGGVDGHVALVLGRVGKNSIKTIEGNTRINPTFDKSAPYLDDNHAILVKSRKWRAGPADHSRPGMIAEGPGIERKKYRGCIRFWTPSKSEMTAWKKGMQRLQKRYSNLRPFRMHDQNLMVSTAFGSCVNEWHADSEPHAVKMTSESRIDLVKNLIETYAQRIAPLAGPFLLPAGAAINR